MVNRVRFVISKEENLASGSRIRLDHSGLLGGRSFVIVRKDRESLWHRHQKGVESAPLASVIKGAIYFFNWMSFSKECLKIIKVHSHNMQFKITGFEITIERFYQTHSHNIHKIMGLIRRFSRRNMSSSRIHFCYIIIGTEFKEKHILERDELFCFVIISSGLKEKKSFL